MLIARPTDNGFTGFEQGVTG